MNELTTRTSENTRLSQFEAEVLRLGVNRRFEALQEKAGLSQLAQLWISGADMPGGGGRSEKMTRPYSQLDLVYICITKVIAAIQALPLVLSTLDEQVVESGPIFDFFYNNPAMSWSRFIRDTVGHYVLTADVFWIFFEGIGKRQSEILIISGKQMYPLTTSGRNDGELIGWEFRGNSGERAQFGLDEVYQWKNFNPYDKFHGLGPADAAKLSMDYDWASMLFNTASLENGAEPGLILTGGPPLNPEQVDVIRNQVDSRHAGAGKAKKTMVVTGGLDVKTIAQSMVDLDVANIGEQRAKRICSSYGVPPAVAGLVTEAQYAFGPAQQDFIYNTILPLAALLGGEITSGILNRFSPADTRSIKLKESMFYHGRRDMPLSVNRYFRGARQKALSGFRKLFAWLDSSAHPVVQEHDREVAAKVLDLTKSGVPLNQIIMVYDLPFEAVPWGDDFLVPMGMIPARYAVQASLEDLTGPVLPEGGTEPAPPIPASRDAEPEELEEKAAEKDDAKKKRIWQKWVLSWLGIEKEFAAAVRTYLVRQQRILLDRLKEVLAEGKAAQKADTNQVVARVVFDLKKENGKLKVINEIFFARAAALGARQAIAELAGLAGSALSQAAESARHRLIVRQALIRSSENIKIVNQTTTHEIAERVARTLAEGLESGEGLPELTKKLMTDVKDVFSERRAQAVTIARTQTAGAVGAGRHAGFQQEGVELHGWLTAGDAAVRDSHVEAGKTYAAGIPLDQPFAVSIGKSGIKEYLPCPGDPKGSAANIVNCRCLETALRAPGKNFGTDFYDKIKFYSYCDMQTEKKDK